MGLISELLLDRAFLKFTLVYIADPSRLKQVMELLRLGGQAISRDSFHMLKVFVAHPKPSPGVRKILVANGAKLTSFLEAMDAGGDETFLQDRQLVVQRLKQLREEGEA